MNKQELINNIWEHARHGWGDSSQYMCAGITKKEVNAVLHYLAKMVLMTLLSADKVNLPGLGQFHASWVESKLRPGEMHLVAHFDYDNKVEAAMFAAKHE